MKNQYDTSFVFIPIPFRVVPPLRRGGRGVSRRNHGLVRGSGTAVLRGIVASAGGTGYASNPPCPPFVRGGRDRSLSQQKRSSRSRASSTVNPKFSSPQGGGSAPHSVRPACLRSRLRSLLRSSLYRTDWPRARRRPRSLHRSSGPLYPPRNADRACRARVDPAPAPDHAVRGRSRPPSGSTPPGSFAHQRNPSTTPRRFRACRTGRSHSHASGVLRVSYRRNCRRTRHILRAATRRLRIHSGPYCGARQAYSHSASVGSR